MAHQVYRGVSFDAEARSVDAGKIDGLVYRGAPQEGEVRAAETVEPMRSVSARRLYRGVTWTPEGKEG